MRNLEDLIKNQVPVLMNVGELIPYENNAKRHPSEQIDRIAKSISRFGWQGSPILVDGNNVIVNGHGRRLAALKIGLKQVPVITVNDLTEEERKAFRLVDNRSAVSDYDMEALQREIESISVSGDISDLLGVTFDDKELSFLTSDLGEMDESVFRDDISDVVTEMKDRVEQKIRESDGKTVSIASVLGFRLIDSAYASAIGRFMEVIANGESDQSSAFGEFCKQYVGME